MDLLKSGQVSKNWRREVVAALRNKKVCAVVKSYEDLTELDSFVAYCEPKVINGLKVDFTEEHIQAVSLRHESVQSHYGNLLRLPIKHLQLHVGRQRLSRILMKNVLLGCCRSLMELTITYKVKQFHCSAVASRSMPNLLQSTPRVHMLIRCL